MQSTRRPLTHLLDRTERQAAVQATPQITPSGDPGPSSIPLAAQKGAARMSVRAAAKAAYDTAQTDTVTAARNAMVALLGDTNSEFSTMPELEVHAPPEVPYTLVVFADNDSDIHLGVQQAQGSTDWAVWLLTSDGSGGWTRLGEQVKSLAHLWVLIDTWIPQWAAGVDYAVGDHVVYNGVEYVCEQAHTSQATWTPDVSASLWSVA